jgi:hypothetical protein
VLEIVPELSQPSPGSARRVAPSPFEQFAEASVAEGDLRAETQQLGIGQRLLVAITKVLWKELAAAPVLERG